MSQENETKNSEQKQPEDGNNVVASPDNAANNFVNSNKDLENKILDLEKVISNLNDKLLRTLAESDNLRKRNIEEIEKVRKYALFNFASDLVLVAENFYLAVDNMPKEEIEKTPAIKNFAEAIVMTKRELTKIFEKNNIKRLYPLGEIFDHHFHEAISQVKSDAEDGKVVQVIQAGYSINDRLIRPALVAVGIK